MSVIHYYLACACGTLCCYNNNTLEYFIYLLLLLLLLFASVIDFAIFRAKTFLSNKYCIPI